MDRFSALLIYVALRALQERPGLWRSHSEYNGAGVANLASDRMLFKTEDLQMPATSQLFHELSALSDPLTRKLVDALKRACVEDISRTPWVGELADPDYARKIALASFRATVETDDDRAIVGAETPVTRSYPPARVYDARIAAAKHNLSALPDLQQAMREGDDGKIVALWARMTETATTRPFKPQVEAARARVELAKELEQAIGADNYPAILRIEARLRARRRSNHMSARLARCGCGTPGSRSSGARWTRVMMSWLCASGTSRSKTQSSNSGWRPTESEWSRRARAGRVTQARMSLIATREPAGSQRTILRVGAPDADRSRRAGRLGGYRYRWAAVRSIWMGR